MKVRDAVPEDVPAFEHRAMMRGNQSCTLKSTETARRFYLERGYSEDESADRGTTSGYPLSKRPNVENLPRSEK
jgi:hypothetical protein